MGSDPIAATSSIDEFYQIVNTVDYGKYDVLVTIISNCDSMDLPKQYKNSREPLRSIL